MCNRELRGNVSGGIVLSLFGIGLLVLAGFWISIGLERKAIAEAEYT